jgi:hypothetical protein
MLNAQPAMNAVTAPEQTALSLVEIIDFKWLMAGDGHRVHVEQLQRDPAYARDCLALAATSRIQALREAGQRLSALLGLPAGH